HPPLGAFAERHVLRFGQLLIELRRFPGLDRIDAIVSLLTAPSRPLPRLRQPPGVRRAQAHPMRAVAEEPRPPVALDLQVQTAAVVMQTLAQGRDLPRRQSVNAPCHMPSPMAAYVQTYVFGRMRTNIATGWRKLSIRMRRFHGTFRSVPQNG